MITNSGKVDIHGLTLANGGGAWGGILRVWMTNTVTLTDSNLSGGRAAHGGGAYNRGTLILNHVGITGSTASERGGGLANVGGAWLFECNISGNTAANTHDGASAEGGGIANAGLLIADASTIANNLSRTESAGESRALGGGIANTGGLTLTNSTISGNNAANLGAWPAEGGGLANASPGQTWLYDVTVANNAVSTGGGTASGGGIASAAGGAVFLRNTLLGSNHAAAGPDCSGELQSGDYNLVQDVAACTLTGATAHTVTGLDPQLGPLGDNGGQTLTHALLPGSPAISRGDNATCPPVDQRGSPRPQGGFCDIGAYELLMPFGLWMPVCAWK